VLTIARLRLKAWKCFRDEQVIDLEPSAYAIFAREMGNDQRSNFLGKSSLVEAVDFALFGRLADEFKSRKKGWISRGEKSGEVDLTLSDGSRVVRSQTLTGSERLWYFPPGSPEKGACQAEAQKAIDELVGLSKEDFAATRYFRQGEMARLITLDPGPRLDLVAGWFRLEPLQECEADAAEVLREVARRRDDAIAAAKAAEDSMGATLERAGVPTFDALEGMIAIVALEVEAAGKALDESNAALAADSMREEARAAAEVYERTVAQGKALAETLAEMMRLPEGERVGVANIVLQRTMLENALHIADEKLQTAGKAKGQAEAEVVSKRRVSSGQFDGTCPLVGALCPARAFVDAEGAKMRGAVADATTALERAGRAYDEAAREQGEAATRLSQLEAKTRRLGELREEASRLKPAHERWRALSEASAGGHEAKAAADHARVVASYATERAAGLKGARAAVKDAMRRRDESRAEAERLEVAVRTAAAAVEIFGRNGAQRRMAESALEEIQDRACDMMSAAGIPLQVTVRWSREGSGVAATCAACGEAFPRSEKVKVCARCGQDRGANLVNRLEIEPSAQSGGARDLCGIFVQLAAAAWLVEDREARCAIAMLDEPLAALDRAMRQAVSSHLVSILRETGVAQAFVIGHDRAALDALPARIVIESKDGWSTARVE
jgi:hypothetical protein